MSTHLVSVAEMAERLSLKPKKSGSKTRYVGANPWGEGATKDGFTLDWDGRAIDNNGTRYTTPTVAEKAGISKWEYEPYVSYQRSKGIEPPARDANGNFPLDDVQIEAFPWERATIYEYTDLEGKLLVQVGRIGAGDSKRISQRSPLDTGGFTSTQVRSTPFLYLPAQIVGASCVYICEGEKAATMLNSEFKRIGMGKEHVATTNIGGAGKWKDIYNALLAEKKVYVLPDNDKAGAKHARKVLSSLSAMPPDRATEHLALVELDNLPPKGDVYDWLAAENSVWELLDLAQSTSVWVQVHEEGEVEPSTEQLRNVPQFHFQTLNQLELKPPPEWLVHRFLTVGGTSLLTAKHGSYKSFFAIDLAMCVATGTLWQGFEVRRGRVVYVAAEGASGLTKRAKAWQRRHKPDYDSNLLVLDAPLKVHEEGVRLAFIQAVADFQPALIVLDTLARCAVGLDENSSGDMGIFADAIGELARTTGAHVMTVHHNNKGGEYRGSTALPAAVDTHLSLERTGAEDANNCTLRTEKQKDFEAWAAMGFVGNDVYLSEHGEETSLVFEKAEIIESRSSKSAATGAENQVFEMLQAISVEEGVTSQMWKAACMGAGISERTFFRSSKLLKFPEDGSQPRIVIVSGEEGAQGAKAARYAVREETTATTATTAMAVSQYLDNAIEKALPPLPHSFRSGSSGSGLEIVPEKSEATETEGSTSSSRELKKKSRQKRANAESEAYPAPVEPEISSGAGMFSEQS